MNTKEIEKARKKADIVIETILCCPVLNLIKEAEGGGVCGRAMDAAHTILVGSNQYIKNIIHVKYFYSQAFNDAKKEREERRSKGEHCCDHSMNVYNLIAHALYSAIEVIYGKSEQSKNLMPDFVGYMEFFMDEHKKIIREMKKDPKFKDKLTHYDSTLKSSLNELKASRR